jgi:hypothetical protein
MNQPSEAADERGARSKLALMSEGDGACGRRDGGCGRGRISKRFATCHDLDRQARADTLVQLTLNGR